MKVALIALKAKPYAGRKLVVGEEFMASSTDAKVLKALGVAKDIDRPAPPPLSPVTQTTSLDGKVSTPEQPPVPPPAAEKPAVVAPETPKPTASPTPGPAKTPWNTPKPAPSGAVATPDASTKGEGSPDASTKVTTSGTGKKKGSSPKGE